MIALIAVQVRVGRQHPWLPRRLTGFSFEREPLKKGVAWAEPKLNKVDRFVEPCMTFLVRGPSRAAVALAAIFNALLFYPAALLPFAVLAPASAVLVLAIGVTTTDGRWVLAGYAMTAAAAGLVAYLIFSGAIRSPSEPPRTAALPGYWRITGNSSESSGPPAGICGLNSIGCRFRRGL